MATISERRSSDSTDRDYAEILAQLRTLTTLARDGGSGPGATQLPGATIDPTLNVKEALKSAVDAITGLIDRDREHAAEIRRLEERYADKLDALRKELAAKETERINAINLAETRRIDAARQEDKSNVALALAQADLKQSALSEQVAAQTKVQSEQEGGRALQSTRRQSSQWSTGLVVAGAGTVLVFLVELYRIATGH